MVTNATVNQDEYDRQTEFSHEEQHLENVVGSIDANIRHKESGEPVYAGDGKAADIVKEMQDHELGELRRFRDRPYFGRVDYSTDRGRRSVYIGDVEVRNLEEPQYFIAHRNAPIARLYYSPGEGFFEVKDRITGAVARTEASVELKRMLAIEDAQLLDFDDVLRLPPATETDQSVSSQGLDRRLSGASDTQLSDAVQTIQPEQYEQIASTEKPVLIVQGAAGSGKSLIGLHRIDFILSPFSNIGTLMRPTPERVVMFGPSPAFLDYVSGLLPGLGVLRVRQMTVSQWMLGQFSRRVTLNRDTVFDALMNNRRKLSPSEIEAYLFKGSPKMRRMLDSYASHIAREIRGGLRQVPSDFPIKLNAAEFRTRISQAFGARPEPNAARRYFVNALVQTWLRDNPPRGISPYQAAQQAQRQIGQSLTSWPTLDFRTEYVRLVSEPDLIMRHSRSGDASLSLANAISETSPSGAGQALGMTDLAAALYLDYSLNGFESERFEHVVVDEAQDVSPMEITIMQMHSTNNSFTILGDLRQSILPYKSISNWNQFRPLFDQGSVTRLDSRLTYRSTRQITQYANRILQGLPKRTKTPVAHHRTGERPKLVRSQIAGEMRQAIAKAVRTLRTKDDVRSVAVLTKWRQTAEGIYNTLNERGAESVGLLTSGGLVDTDVTVSPIILTKGLEFDAVIVANASKGDFTESELDRMLLYLSCTRARHHLEIHWHGTRSRIVPDVARLRT